MSAKQYMYAISVVAVRDQAVNNQLFNGLADRSTIMQVAKDLVWQFDPAFQNDIMMINCNISEQCDGGMMYQFGFKYTRENLQKCANDLAVRLDELMR